MKPYVLSGPAKIGATLYAAGATVMLNERQHLWLAEHGYIKGEQAKYPQSARKAPQWTPVQTGCRGCGRR